MRAMLAADASGSYGPVLDVLRALKIPKLQLEILHVVEPIPSYDSTVFAVSAIDPTSLTDMMDETCRSICGEARQAAADRDFDCTTVRADGFPCETILDVATEHAADLIALGSNPKGSLTSLFLGSVALYAVTHAKQSVLAVRTKAAISDRIRAVFATDHSEHAKNALEELLRWRPAGLEHVEVLTAYDMVGKEWARAGHSSAVSQEEVERMVRDRLCQKTSDVADQFRAVGIPADARVERGDVRQAIRKTMQETGANLLVIGARAHGVFERLAHGSTTTHEVSAEPYSVLVVRPPVSHS